MRTTSIAWLVLLTAGALGCGGMVAQGASIQITDAYGRAECDRVVQLVNGATGQFSEHPELEAQAIFLKADCLDRMSREDEAQALFRYVAERHPESPYAYQALARSRPIRPDAGATPEPLP